MLSCMVAAETQVSTWMCMRAGEVDQWVKAPAAKFSSPDPQDRRREPTTMKYPPISAEVPSYVDTHT